jgi:hypothetical protein
MPQSNPTERAELILKLLDKLMPIPEEAPNDVQNQIDAERQMLAFRAGWTSMPIEELRAIASRELS